MYWIFDKPYADPSRLPLATGPVPITLILIAYLLFVLKLGPKFMAKREPFQLRGVLKIYNLIQIAYNTSLLASFVYLGSKNNPYDFSCCLQLPTDHKFKHIDRILSYFYYINKILDLMDTVFFVLRKSYKQVTLLHLIHHVVMTGGGYLLIRFYGYGGQLLIMGILNVIVHAIMYTYYYISSQSATVRKNLWFKKYITIIQLTQFVIVFVHTVWTLVRSDCDTNLVVSCVLIFMCILMFGMFSNFYIRAYIMPKQKVRLEEIKQRVSKIQD